MHMYVPIEKILSVSDRKYGGNGNIEVLAESMRELGLINPLTVRAVADDRYQLVAGRRRMAAAKLLGWSDVSCHIYPIGDDGEGEHFAEIALVENVNRVDMHPLDEALTFRRLLDAGMSLEDMAAYYDRSVSGIYQRIRLGNLIEKVKEKFRDGDMTLSSAAMLASLSAEQQQQFLDRYDGKFEAWYINSFLHSIQRQPLGIIADAYCTACNKRTRHTDTTLFPELNGYDDVCFDNFCYCRKWTALIAARIDALATETGNTATVIFLRGSIPLFYPDGCTQVTLGAKKYALKSIDEYVKTHNVDAAEFFAWDVFVYGQHLEVSCGGYIPVQEAEAEAEDTDDSFLLPDSIPPEQQQAAQEVLGRHYKNSGDFERAVRQTVFEKVLRQVFTEKPDPKRINRFVAESFASQDSKDCFKRCTGKKFSAKSIAALSHAQQLVLLMALSINPWDLPQYENVVAGVVADKNALTRFTGMMPAEIATLYQDTAAELVQAGLATEEEAG